MVVISIPNATSVARPSENAAPVGRSLGFTPAASKMHVHPRNVVRDKQISDYVKVLATTEAAYITEVFLPLVM